MVADHPFINQRYATELAWYVKKGRRGGTTPIKLLKTFVDWARYHKADQIVIADICKVQDHSKLYERLGFTLTEKSYQMKG